MRTLFRLFLALLTTVNVAAQTPDLALRILEIPEARFEKISLADALKRIEDAANRAKTGGRPIQIVLETNASVTPPLVSVNILEQNLALILDFVTEQAGFEWKIANGKVIVYTTAALQEHHRKLLAIPGRARMRQSILPDFTLTDTPLAVALRKIEEMAKAGGLSQIDPASGRFQIVARYLQGSNRDLTVSGTFRGSDLDTVLEVLTKQTGQLDWTVNKGEVVVILPGANLTKNYRRSAADAFADPFAAPVSAGRVLQVPEGPTTAGAQPDFNTEGYDQLRDNPFLSPRNEPLSTFSIDVDTASYSNVRRFLNRGQTPPVDAVRIEELVNYFDYDNSPPEKVENPTHPELPVEHPLATNVEIAAAPWKPEHRLVRIGLKGYEITDAERPASNLVFLLDVSGSMGSDNKLPLVKKSMQLLLNGLGKEDRVAIVVYAGASGLVLESTPANEIEKIREALDSLDSGGSTNAGKGIELAYATAARNLIPDGNNRVVLCTDGDFNVGTTNRGDLARIVSDHAKKGIQISIMGFGMGNYKDDMLETLSNQGDGNYGYIDSEREARKLFGQRLLSTLVVIARDVKIQVEFNPRNVAAYRLIGYENRLLKNRDFDDDTVDAGDIGSGHTVTAFYEIVPPGVDLPDQPGQIDLRYQKVEPVAEDSDTAAELMTLKLRYKWPREDESHLSETGVVDDGKGFEKASRDFQFGASVAEFGMLLRESPHRGDATFGNVVKIAESNLGPDPFGERAEFVKLVKTLVW